MLPVYHTFKKKVGIMKYSEKIHFHKNLGSLLSYCLKDTQSILIFTLASNPCYLLCFVIDCSYEKVKKSGKLHNCSYF